ncbi:MAG TPA: dethiobiotin synthase [Phycisphaeraceae bacterium]
MFDRPPRLSKPGLFITGTDTGVGKTVVTCAIAAALRRQWPGHAIGVCKPFSSGCRRDREGLVSEDAEALAHFADCRLPLNVINPIRLAPPLAPAVAAEETQTAIDWPQLRHSLEVIDRASDAVLIEGVGGLMVPLDPQQPRRTVLDLIAALGYPVLVVTRSRLGTLNHTAMTVRLLRDSGCRVAGLVMNGYDADVAVAEDPSVISNRRWLEKLTGVSVLAVVPRVTPQGVMPHRAQLDPAIIDAAALVAWLDVLKPPRRQD